LRRFGKSTFTPNIFHAVMGNEREPVIEKERKMGKIRN